MHSQILLGSMLFKIFEKKLTFLLYYFLIYKCLSTIITCNWMESPSYKEPYNSSAVGRQVVFLSKLHMPIMPFRGDATDPLSA